MRGLKPCSFHKMNTGALKWRAERDGWWTAAPHEFCNLPSVSWLWKILGNVFSWMILLHKSLCFSPWQPHNSRAQLSSDSTNRTPQNTHFTARVFPPCPAFLQTLPETALKHRPNDRTDHEWRHMLGLIRAHMWHATENMRKETARDEPQVLHGFRLFLQAKAMTRSIQ